MLNKYKLQKTNLYQVRGAPYVNGLKHREVRECRGEAHGTLSIDAGRTADRIHPTLPRIALFLAQAVSIYNLLKQGTRHELRNDIS
jgi:hypothetical protein